MRYVINVQTGERTEEQDAPLPPAPTQAELDAAQTAAAKQRLVEIDIASVRSIREWLAAQPDAPQFVKNHEAAAIAERAKVKP